MCQTPAPPRPMISFSPNPIGNTAFITGVPTTPAALKSPSTPVTVMWSIRRCILRAPGRGWVAPRQEWCARPAPHSSLSAPKGCHSTVTWTSAIAVVNSVALATGMQGLQGPYLTPIWRLFWVMKAT